MCRPVVQLPIWCCSPVVLNFRPFGVSLTRYLGRRRWKELVSNFRPLPLATPGEHALSRSIQRFPEPGEGHRAPRRILHHPRMS
jgi:hypothetical protein